MKKEEKTQRPKWPCFFTHDKYVRALGDCVSPRLGPSFASATMPNPAPQALRLAYVLQMADMSGENGISKKILGQLETWRALGHECRWFQLNPFAEIWPPLAKIPHASPRRGSSWGRIRASRALCREIAIWRPDLIYFRYAYHASGLPALFLKFPCVAEINSDDQSEYPLTLGPLRNLYHRLTRRRVLSPIRGFVPVTRELSRVATPFARPVEVIANAIPLATLQPLPPAPEGAPVELVFMGSARTPWHGLERIGELARLFPDWQIHVIGDDASIWRTVSPLSAPANLIFHGSQPRERYLPLLATATAALGTFGLYRKGMHEACPLKVREYLALGLPVIGACEDTDIPAAADYHLRLPNNASPLAPHRDAIAAFVERWRGRRVPRAAIAHINTDVKETRRLAFMGQILAEWRAEHEASRLARS